MSLLERFKKVKVFAFDVDGVLTNGSLYLMESGEQVRAMNIKDGYALQLAVKKGYHIIIISGSYSEPVIARLKKLGVHDVFMRVENKTAILEEFISGKKITREEVLYMGDDIPDLDIMNYSGLATCPVDAVDDIKEISSYISRFKGGEGCVRDVIEKVLKLNHHWDMASAIKSI